MSQTTKQPTSQTTKQSTSQTTKEPTSQTTKEPLDCNKFLHSTDVYSEAQRRYAELQKVKKDMENQLTKFPEGKIHVVNTKNRVQFYLRHDPKDKSGTYLSKKDKQTLETYLNKQYITQCCKLLESECANLHGFLNKSYISSTNENILISDKLRKIYSDTPEEIKEIITPIDVSDDDYVMAWLASKYTPKEIFDDLTYYISDKGNPVRSKSELNIANMLYKMKIPYHYEKPIKLKRGTIVYPDFTVLDVKNRREIIWEHRGMMDDREYAKHSVMRVKEYNKYGYFLGENLIITEETATQPLGTDEIRRIIEHFFVK